MLHSQSKDNHRAERWVVADEAALTSLTHPYTGDAYTPVADDVGCIAYATAEQSYWRLDDHDPLTWVQIGGSGEASGAAGGVLSGTYPNPSFAEDMATQAELDAEVAALEAADQDILAAISASQSGQTPGTFLETGVQVTWSGSGYVYDVSGAAYWISGTRYTYAGGQVTLTAADATYNRIDTVYFDASGAGVLAGTPADDPLEPSVDPETQLRLTILIVTAASTEPDAAVNEDVFLEGTEWTNAASGAGVSVNSTNDPRTGAKSVEFTNVSNGGFAGHTKPASGTIDPSGFTHLAMWVKAKAAFPSKGFRVRCYNASSVAVGSSVNVQNGRFGFDSSNTTAYQLVAIPVAEFGFPSGTVVGQIREIANANALGMFIDDIQWIASGGGSSSGSYLTRDQADASYAQLADFDAHLADTADAHDASAISFDPTGLSNVAATEVQTALEELDAAIAGAGSGDMTKAVYDPNDDGVVDVAQGGTGAATAAGARTALDVPATADLTKIEKNTQTDSYTLVLTDAGKVVEGDKVSAMNVTVPPNSSVAFPVGTVIEVCQIGAGQVTIVAGSGVTLRSYGNKLKCTGQYSTAGLRKRATDEWVVSGDLSA